MQAAGRKDEKKKAKPPPLVTLTLVSFSTTRKAYERITARFVREYQAATGQPVRFRLSFGGSGTQVRPDLSAHWPQNSTPCYAVACRSVP